MLETHIILFDNLIKRCCYGN